MKTLLISTIVLLLFIPETLCKSLNYRIVKSGTRITVIDHGVSTVYYTSSSGELPTQVQQAVNNCRAELNDL